MVGAMAIYESKIIIDMCINKATVRKGQETAFLARECLGRLKTVFSTTTCRARSKM